MKPGPKTSKSREAVLMELKKSKEPAMSAGDVADRVSFSRKTVTKRLNELADEGRINTHSIGGNTAYSVADSNRNRKFTNGDILAVFNEQHRLEVGKIELSVAEITELLNSRVLDETKTVTRQAVNNRIDELVGKQLVRVEHGRTLMYRKAGDIDRLFDVEPREDATVTQKVSSMLGR